MKTSVLALALLTILFTVASACGGAEPTPATTRPDYTSVPNSPAPGDSYNENNIVPELVRRGDATGPLEEFNEAIRRDPQSSGNYYYRGEVFRTLGQYERAIEDYDAAIRLSPRFADAHNGRGVAYYRIGRNQRALEDYDAAIRIDTQLAEAYANRAVVFTRLGQDPQAEQDIGRAITLGIDSILLQAKIDELKRWR